MKYSAFIRNGLLVLLLSACSGPVSYYAVPSAPVSDRIAVRYRSIELREVSLPTYAASSEIFQEGPDRALKSSATTQWADDPARSLKLELVGYLAELTGARVAPGPWPFATFPQAQIDILLTEMVARQDGSFNISGQYFVTGTESGVERSEIFKIAVPIAQPAHPTAIAAARARATLTLADQIARKGLN